MLEEFIKYLSQVKNYSPVTINRYRLLLDRFFARHKRITNNSINKFREELLIRGIKQQSINLYLLVLRCFLRFQEKQGIQCVDPDTIELAKISQRKIEIIEMEDFEKMRIVATDIRDKAILETLFSTGMRVSELCSINIDDIPKNGNRITIRGKGGKIRMVVLSSNAKVLLEKIIADKKDIIFNRTLYCPLFTSHGRPLRRLTVRQIQRIVGDIAKRAGISRRVTPHMLRHLLATQMIRGGMNIAFVQKTLGHSSIATTQIYLHIEDNDLSDAMDAFHKNKKNEN